MYTMPPMNPEVARLRRQAARRKYQKRMRKVKMLWAFAALLMFVLLIEVLVAVSFSPRFWIYQINVIFEREDTLNAREIITLVNLPERSNYYRTSLSKLAEQVRKEPRVAGVSVRRGKIGVLVVNVTEREPVCQLAQMTPPLYLDVAGYAFTRPSPPSSPVPLVFGVKLPPPAAKGTDAKKADTTPYGAKVDTVEAQAVLGCLKAVAQERTDFPSSDVIRISIGANGQITLVLRQGAKVLIGRASELPEKMWAAGQMVVDAAKAGYPIEKVASIDVRYINVQTDPSQTRHIVKGACYTPVVSPEVTAP